MKDNNLLSIENLVKHVNENHEFYYESEQLRKANSDFYDKLKEVISNSDLVENIFNDHEEAVIMAEQDYFKAGFSAGVRLLAEALGMNI